jgi:Skp family chaperone for outer membrane proteins|tara:strand:- start:580 stop:1173 length:594 start_codon:yes stop_codon:yes gene_type:complete
MDYILSNIDDYKTANEEYDIKLNLWRKEIESRTNKIESRLKELAIKKPLLPDEVYQNLIDEIDFDKKQLEQYAQKRFGPKGDWLVQEKILIQPIQDEVLAIVQEIADKNKFDFIFDKSSAIIMLYSEKKYDISELVLKSILKQEKIENLQLSFDDDRKKVLEEKIQKRRDSILKLKELKKIKRDSLLKTKRNNLKNK